MLTFSDFPAHARLMLLAARVKLRPEEVEQVETLATTGSVDWNSFLAVTEHHRLSSLVYESLQRIHTASVPEFVWAALRVHSTANAFEALRSASEVRRITAQFADAGFELALLKGVPLSQFLFGHPNTRHVGDIDLLTEPVRLPEQIALLERMGYQRVNPKSRLTPQRIASYVSFWKGFTFRTPDGTSEIDLHWRLFNNRFHAANRILAEATYRTVMVFGVPMRVFSPRDQFIHIATHGVLDAWTYLKSLADVAGFLRLFTESELEDALLRAESLGLLAQISGAIHLANDWMGTNIQSKRLLPTTERTARKIRERTTRMLLLQDFKPERSYASPAEWLRLEIALVPGARSLAEIARRFVWRPRVWAAVDLPDELFWVYPVLGLLLLPRFHSVDE